LKRKQKEETKIDSSKSMLTTTTTTTKKKKKNGNRRTLAGCSLLGFVFGALLVLVFRFSLLVFLFLV
jgi:hypothetical protein